MPKLLLHPVQHEDHLRYVRDFRGAITHCERVPINVFSRGVGYSNRGAVAQAALEGTLSTMCKEYLDYRTNHVGLSDFSTSELRSQAATQAIGLKHPVLAIDKIIPTVHQSYVSLPRWNSLRSFIVNLDLVRGQRERVVFSYSLDVVGRICEYKR